MDKVEMTKRGDELFITVGNFKRELILPYVLALTGSSDGTAALWDLSTRPPAAKSLSHGGPVETVAFSADGHTAITADLKDGSVLGGGLR